VYSDAHSIYRSSILDEKYHPPTKLLSKTDLMYIIQIFTIIIIVSLNNYIYAQWKTVTTLYLMWLNIIIIFKHIIT
jgi:hypothetical protein